MTCGGARSGNSAIGNVGMAAPPARMMRRAQTVAKIGRRMKKSTNISQCDEKRREVQRAERGRRIRGALFIALPETVQPSPSERPSSSSSQGIVQLADSRAHQPN